MKMINPSSHGGAVGVRGGELTHLRVTSGGFVSKLRILSHLSFHRPFHKSRITATGGSGATIQNPNRLNFSPGIDRAGAQFMR